MILEVLIAQIPSAVERNEILVTWYLAYPGTSLCCSSYGLEAKCIINRTEDKIYLMFIGPCIILIVELRETNLKSLAFLFNYLMLNMFRMLIYQFSGARELFVKLFHGLYCSGSMRVGVTVWFAWAGVVSGYRLKH